MQKIVWITGGNDGIGRATAQVLLERDYFVLISGRCPKKLAAAVATLKHRTGKDNIDWILCDMANFDSIKEAAKVFKNCYSHLDILINNAGVFSSNRELSDNGIEKQFAINYLGHFLLTQLLIPWLSLAPEARIINVASADHYKGKIDFNNLCACKPTKIYCGLEAYAQSKLAMVLFTKELAERYPDISSNCLHPGIVRTHIASKGGSWYHTILWTLYKPFMRHTRCGARTAIYLATSPEVRNVKGRYFDQDQACKKPSKLARDPQLADQLWQWSEQQIGEIELF